VPQEDARGQGEGEGEGTEYLGQPPVRMRNGDCPRGGRSGSVAGAVPAGVRVACI